MIISFNCSMHHPNINNCIPDINLKQIGTQDCYCWYCNAMVMAYHREAYSYYWNTDTIYLVHPTRTWTCNPWVSSIARLYFTTKFFFIRICNDAHYYSKEYIWKLVRSISLYVFQISYQGGGDNWHSMFIVYDESFPVIRNNYQ